MNKTRGFSKDGIWPFNRMAFSDNDYSPSCRTNQNNNTQELATHTPSYSCEEFFRASVSSSVTPNAPRKCRYCTWAHMPRGNKAIKQCFRERNKRQELEKRKSRIYNRTLENTRIFYTNKNDKKLQTTRMICNSNKRISCDTYASDLGDKLVSDYQNPKDRGRPKRLLSDNNHIKSDTISVVCHPDRQSPFCWQYWYSD